MSKKEDTVKAVSGEVKTEPTRKGITAAQFRPNAVALGEDRNFLALLDQTKEYASIDEIRQDIQKLKKREVK